ncbi:MAG: InlB B-repeat-containing protein, partial [Rhodoferax sp.]|nr:InlB B-repeat-containing protein [Rhodoferax sp.]
YDANLGTGIVPGDANSPYTEGATVTVLGNIGVPALTRFGYIFGGWNNMANGSGMTYAAGATFSMPANAVTLYAIWTENEPTVTTYPINLICFGDNSGAVNIDVSSGTPPYTYLWSNSATTQNTSLRYH